MDCQVSVESTGEVDRKINIGIPRALYQSRFDSMLNRAAQSARLKGFRPGRAPKAMVAKLYGEQIHSDVMNEIVGDAFKKAVTDNSLKVVGNPDVQIEGGSEGADFQVTATVSVFPEPKLTNYTGHEVEVELEKADESAVEDAIEKLRAEMAKVEKIEDGRGASDGDIGVIDYKALIDGEEFPHGEGKDIVVTLGSGKLPKELEDGIVGMTVDSTKDVSVVLPESFSVPEYVGKTAVYNVSLKGLYARTLPELTDELAKEVGLGETAVELREKIAKRVASEVNTKNKDKTHEAVLKKIADANPFVVPQPLIDEEIRFFLFEAGLLDSNKHESYHVDVARFRERLGTVAEWRARRRIILDSLVEIEKVEADEEAVTRWLDSVAAEHETDRAEIDKVYGFPKNLNQLKKVVAREQLLARLVDGSKVTQIGATQIGEAGAAEAKPEAKKTEKKKKSKKDEE
jgi:trigger factor